MRHPILLAVLGLLIVVLATNGIAALPWASNVGCQDIYGARDADVSVQLVPFGLVCHYEADSTRPPETVVRAPGIPVFAAWLLFVGAVVAVGLRKRAKPAARGLVSGVVVLGLFGFAATAVEMDAAMAATALYGIVVPAVVEPWLWPAAGRWWALVFTALLLPFTVVATWVFPGLFGAEWVAAALAFAAAAAIAAACSRVRTLGPALTVKG